MPAFRYAAYPTATLYQLGSAPGGQPPADPVAAKQLLWGDELEVLGASDDARYLKVFVRNSRGWIRADQTQQNRLLDIMFVDIGQGDGALVVTPEGRRYLVDAGKGDNMARFLRWRFGFKDRTTFDAAVLSHSDEDHYGGLHDLFKEPNVRVERLYMNGLMERVAERDDHVLGVPVASNGRRYITGLVQDRDAFDAFSRTPENWKNKRYPTLLRKALDSGQLAQLRMLDAGDRYLPGHEEDQALVIKVLGPVPEQVDGQKALRWFGDAGKTKNGHSIVLHLTYGNVRIFLGGDLNLAASRYLLEHYTGLDPACADARTMQALTDRARPVFESDIAKACHHGSADTLLPLIRSINPAATIISSGDDEAYAHPRADALGAIAKSSRGERPLLLSTELARSSKEAVKHPHMLRKQLQELGEQIAIAGDARARKRAQDKFGKTLASLDRSVAVFGAINLRTDGKNAVLAYKMERPTPAKGWDIYRLTPDAETGLLSYRSEHDRPA